MLKKINPLRYKACNRVCGNGGKYFVFVGLLFHNSLVIVPDCVVLDVDVFSRLLVIFRHLNAFSFGGFTAGGQAEFNWR